MNNDRRDHRNERRNNRRKELRKIRSPLSCNFPICKAVRSRESNYCTKHRIISLLYLRGADANLLGRLLYLREADANPEQLLITKSDVVARVEAYRRTDKEMQRI